MNDKKQKILLAVLAVVALGAGSYFFVFRDTGDGARAGRKEGTTVRQKVEAAKPEDSKTTRRTTKETTAAAPTTTTRRKTDESAAPTSSKRVRSVGEKGKVTKKKSAPAA